MFVRIARKAKSAYVEMYTVILPMCLCFHSDFVSRINVIMLVWSYTPEGWPSGNLYWSVMSRRVTSPGALVKTMRPTWVRFTLTGSMVPSLLREWNTTSLLTCREKEHWLKHTKNTGLDLTWTELERKIKYCVNNRLSRLRNEQQASDWHETVKYSKKLTLNVVLRLTSANTNEASNG